MRKETDREHVKTSRAKSVYRRSGEPKHRDAESTIPSEKPTQTSEQRRAAMRAHPQRRALHGLHGDVVDLKNRLWTYVTQKACTRFIGGQPHDVLALSEGVRRVATEVAEAGSRIQSDTARHAVTSFANHATLICDLDALSSMTAMVRAYELYMAAEPALDRLVEEWTQCGPMVGLPGIDLDDETISAS